MSNDEQRHVSNQKARQPGSYATGAPADVAASADKSDSSRDPFEELASEFADRQRQGELPSVEEYARAHPELAEEIRELFPTIAAMEQLKVRKAVPARPTMGGLPLDQLGDFRILGEIGRGGMGVVYEAEQVSLGRHVAVKVLPQQSLLDERHLRRFEREAQTAAKLHHTNIVPVFGVGQQDGYHYIVMQFIPGVGLDEVLVALRRLVFHETSDRFHSDTSSRASHANHNAKALLDGQFRKASATGFSSATRPTVRPQSEAIADDVTVPLPSITEARDALTDGLSNKDTNANLGPESRPAVDPFALSREQAARLAELGAQFYRSVAMLGVQVGNALAYAHEQGTLHRDIKPGNLLLDSTGTVWVADFGLAKLMEQDHVSRTGDIVGTLAYMPPESFSGETDARGDIYALGLTLFEMLTLRPVYFGRDRGKLVRQITEGDIPRISKLNPSIPRDLATVVLKAIAHRPADRYATAQEFSEDLQRYLDDLPIRARPVSPPEALWRWCRRNRLVAGLATSALSLLVLAAVLSGIVARNAVQQREEAIKQREFTQETTSMGVGILIDLFDSLAGPNRLPLSSDNSLETAASFEEETALQSGGTSDDNAERSKFVTPPPIDEQRLETLERILPGFEALSRRGGNAGQNALVYAELARRVGTSQQAIGKHDEARTSFQNAILKFQEIVTHTTSAAAVVGLAQSYNDLGSSLAVTQNREGAEVAHREALSLLDSHATMLDASLNGPLARYERARSLYLMSNQIVVRWRRRPDRGDPIATPRPRGPQEDGFGPGPISPGPPDVRDGSPVDANQQAIRRLAEFAFVDRISQETSRRGLSLVSRFANGPGFPPGRNVLESGDRGMPPGFPGRQGGGRPNVGRGGRGGRGNGRDPGVQNLQEAISVLTELCKSENNPEFRYLLAKCLADGRLGADTLPQAVKLLEALVEEQPGVADYRFELAMAYSRQVGRFGQNAEEMAALRNALTQLDRIVRENVNIAHYAHMRCTNLLRMALTQHEIARQLEVDSSRVDDLKLARSDAAKLYERTDEAIRDYRTRFTSPESKISEPHFFWARMRHAELLLEMGAPDLAARVYRDAIEDVPATALDFDESLVVRASLATVLAADPANHEEAVAVLDACRLGVNRLLGILRNQHDIQLWIVAEWIVNAAADAAAAVEGEAAGGAILLSLAESAIQTSPDGDMMDLRATLLKSKALRRMGQIEAADETLITLISELEAAVARNRPENGRPQGRASFYHAFLLRDAYVEAGRENDADELLSRIFQRDRPSGPPGPPFGVPEPPPQD